MPPDRLPVRRDLTEVVIRQFHLIHRIPRPDRHVVMTAESRSISPRTSYERLSRRAEPWTSVARERDEADVFLIVADTSFSHRWPAVC